ncbi:MAG: glycosyltransferase family 2 protein [Phycisphaerales bacterium]|nr:glycosyltransferase family 2 protein [Phycisphaerales bacterium]
MTLWNELERAAANGCLAGAWSASSAALGEEAERHSWGGKDTLQSVAFWECLIGAVLGIGHQARSKMAEDDECDDPATRPRTPDLLQRRFGIPVDPTNDQTLSLTPPPDRLPSRFAARSAGVIKAIQMNPQDQHGSREDDLAVCFTTFNSMRTMPRALSAACALTKNIVVVDSGSTDGTIDLCRKHGIEPVHRDWTNPAEQKKFAMSLCSGTIWTLVLDSDEVVTEDLASEIRRAIADASEDDTGFEMNRVSWLHGRPLRNAFQPEWRLRLFRSNAGVIKSDAAGVHDRFEVRSGRSNRLQGTLRHDAWADVGDMLGRGVRWSVQTGGDATRGGRITNICFNPVIGFLKQLLLKRAFRDGWRGWVAAGAVGVGTLSKHLVIMERRGLERERAKSADESRDS